MKRFLLPILLVGCSAKAPPPEMIPTATPTLEPTSAPTSVPTTDPSSHPQVEVPPVSTKRTDVELSNEFAVKLFVPLATAKEENVTISATSIRLALGLVSIGAKGSTQAEMNAALSLHPEGAGVHAKAELAGWKSRVTKGVSITIANRLFADKTFAPIDTFLARAKSDFEADLQNVDFLKSPEPSRKIVNDWVKKATADKIPEILPTGSVTPDTKLVVTNAVHFLATWKKPFDVKATADLPFFVRGATEKKLPTMQMKSRFSYAEDADVTLAELPYADGKVSMVIALPKDKKGLSGVLGKMRGDTLGKWQTALEQGSHDLELTLPKFELKWGASLKPSLEKLGMRTVFTESADLSGMSAVGKLFVSDVFHKTYVRVDEKGTEAAAATGVVVGVTSLPPPPKPFVVDHPFIYFLLDKTTGRVLFLGTVVDPSVKP